MLFEKILFLKKFLYYVSLLEENYTGFVLTLPNISGKARIDVSQHLVT